MDAQRSLTSSCRSPLRPTESHHEAIACCCCRAACSVGLSFRSATRSARDVRSSKLPVDEAVERPRVSPPDPHELFGYAVHHALRARFCIRSRPLLAVPSTTSTACATMAQTDSRSRVATGLRGARLRRPPSRRPGAICRRAHHVARAVPSACVPSNAPSTGCSRGMRCPRAGREGRARAAPAQRRAARLRVTPSSDFCVLTPARGCLRHGREAGAGA